MKFGFNKKILQGASAVALAMSMAPLAHAQDAQPGAAAATDDTAASTDDEEIVVTGTSIRGVAPAGSETVGLNQEQIAATNSTSTVQLLTRIPQIGGFNTIQSVTSVGNQQTANRPAVRGLSAGQSGGSPTLILMDGRRIAGAGVAQSVPDPDVVPPGAISRVEVVTEGGSAVYGSDAVGGVINLITRKDYDGMEFNVRQGFGDEFSTTEAFFTAGHTWTGGSAYITYDYSQHDAIYGRDRDYVRNISYSGADAGLGLNTSCFPGSIGVNGTGSGADGTSFQIVNGAPGPAASLAQTRCDQTDNVALVLPQERRDSIFFNLSQELTPALSFDFRAWYTNRVTKVDKGPHFGALGDLSTTITDPNDGVPDARDNAFFQSITGLPGETQTVHYDFTGAGLNTIDRVEYQVYGISPEFTLDLGHDWQARAYVDYGLADTAAHNPGISSTAITANIANINFYNLGATNPAILNSLTNEEVGHGTDEILNSRAVFDGPLFDLPGGTVRAALGAEYLGEKWDGYDTQRGADPTAEAERRSHAFFAEFNVPLVSAANNIPFVNDLSVNLAWRHDTYSDFGSTTNPQYAITYSPMDWVHFRGKWGTSFQAPSLVDVAGQGAPTVSVVPTFFLGSFLPTTNNADFNHGILIVGFQGAGKLDAQHAESFSLGFDISPPIVPGLDMGLTYWHNDYAGKIGSPCSICSTFWTSGVYNNQRIYQGGNPIDPSLSTAFVTAHGGDLGALATALSSAGLTVNDINVVIDNRKFNIGGERIAGWDAYIHYNHDVSFGTVYFTADGTYAMTDKKNDAGLGFGPNLAANDILGTFGPRWSVSSTLGATIGDDWRAQATVQYTASYHADPNSFNGQGPIDAVYPIDLYGEYNGFKDLTLSLGINNVFDQDPAHLKGFNSLTYGYVGGNLGRVVYLGASKRF